MFKIKQWIITLTLPREEIKKHLADYALSFRMMVPIKIEGRIFPFVVFPIVITSELEVKQTGEGIFCENESEAAEIRNEIQKNKTPKPPPVVLASWNGGFTIATVIVSPAAIAGVLLSAE